MSEHSAVPANTVEATRDLQERVGRFALTTGTISSVMLLATLSAGALTGSSAAPLWSPSRAFHISATALCLAIWRLMRQKTLQLSTIHALDGALLLTLCACWALLGLGSARTEPIEFTVILATTYTLIARSVLVPSSFARTLCLSAVSVVPTLVFFFVRQMSFMVNASRAHVHRFLLFATLWCLVAVATAAVQSRLLFGLRERIREATKLGQYTLQEKIGEGGMGAVFRATHAMLRRPAAIKLLLPGRAGEREVARFEREVQLTSRLQHPNTISIFDYGRAADGTFYYVMELLDGFDLDSLVEAEGPLPPWRVLRILSQASGALVEAHGLGLIHRDIKPANILLTERSDEPDIVKVVDFGLVKSLGEAANELTTTQPNVITGTPLYLAPESISAPDSIDARADLYALGAVGFFLLTGTHVFEGRTVVEVCSKHLLEPPIPPSQRTARPIPAELDALVLACLAKSPADRPASASVLKQALDTMSHQHAHDTDAAKLWWHERAPALRSRRAQPERAATQASMTVDLLARA